MISLFENPSIRQYAIVIIVNLCVLSVGLNLAWTSPVLVKLSDATSPVLGRPITENEGSWIVSIPSLTGLFANFILAYIIEKFGRKTTFVAALLPRVVGYLLLIFATEVWMILVGRVFTGISDGFAFAVVPTYASEIASSKIRGSLGTILQIFSSLGIVMMLSMGPFLDYFVLNVTVLSIAVVTAIPLFFLPDSPYYLHKIGKTAEAFKILTYLRGSEEEANQEIKEYSTQKEEKISFTEVFQSKTVLKAIGISIVIGAGSQLTGQTVMSYYLQTILESTKTTVSSQIASVIIGVIQLVASLVTAVTIDRFGRKPIICTSLVGLAIGLGGLGLFFKLAESNSEIVGFLNFLPLASLVVVIYSYGAGLGSLLWLLFAELFEGRFRPTGVSIGLFSSMVAMFLVTRFFAPITSLIGPALVYWIFSFNTLALCIFVLFCVPETKGRSFAEIQAALKGKRETVVVENGSKNGP